MVDSEKVLLHQAVSMWIDFIETGSAEPPEVQAKDVSGPGQIRVLTPEQQRHLFSVSVLQNDLLNTPASEQSTDTDVTGGWISAAKHWWDEHFGMPAGHK